MDEAREVAKAGSAEPGLRAKRILWVDDEVRRLRPHLLFLRQRGYRADIVSNGADALALLAESRYDLVLLDEQMPGMNGMEVLQRIRQKDAHAPVVMVTKSEDDGILNEAIGRQVQAYLVKPASPRQVLSVVTRILEGSSIRQQQTARDFADCWPGLAARRSAANSPGEFARIYRELVRWHLALGSADERVLLEALESMYRDLRKDFGPWAAARYPAWIRGRRNPPPLSVHVVRRWLRPMLERNERAVLFVVLDCMRMDQWAAISPLLARHFNIEEAWHYSILPTATPFARNALFSGLYPDEMARREPGWAKKIGKEGALNAEEQKLLRAQLRRLLRRDVPVHYEKVLSDRNAGKVRRRIRAATGRRGSVVALVFNFVDLVTHGRSESPILMEVARDETALRRLTASWFERSTLFAVLKDAAARGCEVLMTTDHGSIHCRRPAEVRAGKDATPGLRYKLGHRIQVPKRRAALVAQSPAELRLPPRGHRCCAVAMDDHYFVYPTRLRHYERRYRNSFLHGGISPEEMIVPTATLSPRRG